MSSFNAKYRLYTTLVFLGLIIPWAALAQNQAPKIPTKVQWASKVEDKSSEENDRVHSARWALGWPNAVPQGGFSGAAWQPKKDGGDESIKVGFERPMPITRVIVVENVHPGSVSRVVAYEPNGKEHVLKNIKPVGLKDKYRILTIDVPKTAYSVASIRVDLKTGVVRDIQQIDAIGIGDNQETIQLIRTASDLDVNSKPERLGVGINSGYPDFGPVISPDGGTLYFSRRHHPGNVGGKEDMEDIWVSRYLASSNSWQPAENIGKPLNNESYNFVSSVTPDGNSLLLGNVYLPDGSMEAGASVSTRTPQGWTEPKEVGIIREKNKNEKVNYFLSASGRVLLISEQRKDSWGGRDLYASFREADDIWSQPQNLGDVVNTPNEDYAPFLAADERTLYFSTSGRAGYGGDDIFITRRIGDGWDKWTEPENLGKPINGTGDDAYFTIPASGQYAYFASAADNSENQDIYRIVLPKSQRPKPVVLVSGKTLDSKTNKPVSTRVIYEDLSTGKLVGEAISEPMSGAYQIALPSGDNYGFLAVADNYFSISSNLDLRALSAYKEITRDLYLTPREVGATVRLNNLFFDFDKSELRPESYPELNRVVAFMKASPSIEIEVDGHTDSVGTADYNMKLSERRVQSVLDYLKKNGTSDARLTQKAFGSSQPKASNKTDEGRQQNRRVEFVLKKL